MKTNLLVALAFFIAFALFICSSVVHHMRVEAYLENIAFNIYTVGQEVVNDKD